MLDTFAKFFKLHIENQHNQPIYVFIYQPLVSIYSIYKKKTIDV